MTDPREPLWQRMVEEANAIFVGVQHGGREPVVLFQSAPRESTIALWASAMDGAEAVRMAVRAYEDAKRMVKAEGL